MVKLCGENGRRTSGWGSLAVEYCCNGSKLLHVWNILYLHECHMFMIHVGTVHIPYMEHLGWLGGSKLMVVSNAVFDGFRFVDKKTANGQGNNTKSCDLGKLYINT